MGGGSDGIEETADQVEQAKINAKLWDYYNSTYKPQIDKYIERTTNEATTEAEGRQMSGQIRGEMMKNVNQESASENPVVNAKSLSKLATTESKAQVSGQSALRERKIGQLQNIIDIGRGEETEAQTGLSALASQSVSSAISDAEQDASTGAAAANTLGSAVGLTGALAYKKLTTKEKTLELP